MSAFTRHVLLFPVGLTSIIIIISAMPPTVVGLGTAKNQRQQRLACVAVEAGIGMRAGREWPFLWAGRSDLSREVTPGTNVVANTFLRARYRADRKREVIPALRYVQRRRAVLSCPAALPL